MLENDWKFGWGIEYFLQNSLAKILLPSSLAALKLGPKTLIFLFSKKSTIPFTRGVSGPTITTSIQYFKIHL